MTSKPPPKKPGSKKNVWTEFDCPQCSAHNPWDTGFTLGDEIFCSWCGAAIHVKATQTGDEGFKLALD